MDPAFKTSQLAVGYNRIILLDDINICLGSGKILTLIGPNGAGKSTILKTITKQLAPISGDIFVSGKPIQQISAKEFARKTAVVLTERIHPELMTCAEVVAMGRYPYTDVFGNMSEQDKKIVTESLERVHALDLAERDFMTLSDGQQQRIMLARAICQEPEIIVLDEPTAYLDVHYKIELLQILREMAREKGTVIIMSLHEIDLAMKISDELLCVDGSSVIAYGTPEEVMTGTTVQKLFGILPGAYNLLFGSVELPKPQGEPKVFVIAGNGKGTPIYRLLQKNGIPFATGILFENDVDCQTAEALSSIVIKSPAFDPVADHLITTAKEIILKCGCVLDACTKHRSLNSANFELIAYAQRKGIPVISSIEEIQ